MRHEDMAHSVAAVAELQDQLSEISSTTSLFTLYHCDRER